MKKKIMMIATFVLAVYNMILAEDKITINDFNISAGEQKEVVISLNNDAAYVAFQFDLYLPEGITIETYRADNARVPESTTLSMSQQADGSYRFIAAAMNGASLVGNSGGVVTLTVKASISMTAGYYTGSFRKVRLAKADATGPKYGEMSFSINVVNNEQTPITITVNDCLREYGDSNPIFEYSVTGGTLTGEPSITCSATENSPVGAYPIVIEQGSVSDDNIIFVNGTLTIEKAPLKIIADNKTMTQGGDLPELTVSYQGFKNGEDSSVLTQQPTIMTTATKQSASGTYPIVVSGGSAKNYSLSYQSGTLTVTNPEPNPELSQGINVEREIGMGYTLTAAFVDFTEAKEFMGVEEITYDMLRIVNPNGKMISDYAPFDGWFNEEGVAEQWGSNTKICVKFFEAIPDGEFSICDMNGADEVGKTYTVKWALVANDKTVNYTINVTFVEPEPVVIEIAENVIEASVEYDTTEDSYVEKSVVLTDDQVAAILSELGLASLDEADVYGFNPTTADLIPNYAGYDGWRNADGDFAYWSGNSSVPACVKYTDGKTYLCYNIQGCEGSIKTYWAIASETKAVLVEITFTYTGADSINGISLDSENNVVYDLTGRRVKNVVKGNLYIVGGEKVLAK